MGSAGKELGALLADQVRFIRWKNAERILRRAAQFAKARGIKPNEVPVKFLVPFLEKASLEDWKDNKAVIDMWAHLLTSAISGYQSRQILYIDILGKLSSADAKLLSLMHKRIRSESLYDEEDIDVDLWNIGDCEEVTETTRLRLEKKKDALLKDFGPQGLSAPIFASRLHERLIKRASRSSSWREDIVPVYFDLNFYYDKESLNGMSGPLEKGFYLDSIMNLVGFKLLERFTVSARLLDAIDLRKELRATVVWICLTSLGLDFIRACHPTKLNRQRS
jgi:Abortive infection alpha